MVARKLAKSPFPAGSGYKDGIYHSKWPVVPIPEDPYLDLVTHSLDHPNVDWVALVDAPTGASMTYRELKYKIFAVAAGLADLGMKQRDVVMIVSPNGSHFPIVVLAVIAVGGVLTAVNPANLSSEIDKQATDSGTKFVFATTGTMEKVVNLKLPIILIDNFVEDGPMNEVRGIAPVASVSELYKCDPSKAPKVRIRQTDLALLMYSSGTTGLSKGVKITHRNVIATSVMCTDPSEDLTLQKTLIAVIPLCHVFGMVTLLVCQLKRGAKFVIMPRFNFSKMLEAVERYRVSRLSLVPPILVTLLKSPIVNNYDLSSVDTIGVGAAPVGKELHIATVERFKDVFLSQGYGMTETCGKVADNPAVENSSAPYGTVGFLNSHVEARVVDLESGDPLPPEQTGELWLRGPCITAGYLNNDKATAETLDGDGWLHTGDVAHFDAEGYLFIVDRLKEMIKYNGFQVAPAELEAILLSHPEILDGAIVGFPDEQTGQIPVAFVMRRSSSLTAEAVIDFVAKQVAPYKKVRKVLFVESIPKSQAGKVLRRELKAPPTSKLSYPDTCSGGECSCPTTLELGEAASM